MVITLLSDFGYQDNFVAIVKGTLLGLGHDVDLVDLGHEVEPFHLLQCSYLLGSGFADFPKGTIHLCLFDMMHQKPATILCTEAFGHYFISADNGLLPLTLDGGLGAVYALPEEAKDYKHWLRVVKDFLNEWPRKDDPLSGLSRVEPMVKTARLNPIMSDDAIEGQVIHIDRFENVVVNITKAQFERHCRGRRFRISFIRDSITKISGSYNDVPVGEKLGMFNSAGFLEIAINQGKASSLLGLKLHNDRQLIYQNVKIYFYDN